MIELAEAIKKLILLNFVVGFLASGLYLYNMFTSDNAIKNAVKNFASKYPDVVVNDLNNLLSPFLQSKYYEGISTGALMTSGATGLMLTYYKLKWKKSMKKFFEGGEL